MRVFLSEINSQQPGFIDNFYSGNEKKNTTKSAPKGHYLYSIHRNLR